jgi:hypothetical protein
MRLRRIVDIWPLAMSLALPWETPIHLAKDLLVSNSGNPPIHVIRVLN